MSYKPDGYTDAAPYLIVADLIGALDFIEAAFQGQRLRVINRPDGTPMHAEARIGDSVVMLGQAPGGGGAHVHLYVPDVHATYQAGLSAGAQAVQEPLDQNDGDIRAGLRDPFGTTWWPATQK